jgi:phosphopentomutase
LPEVKVVGCYGKMMTKSPAKDTTIGHWEMSCIKEIIDSFEKLIGTKVLGNCVILGTEIIKQLGAPHQKTGYPIVYTSADSVFQIAAHEESFGLNRLYEI